jgi:hypothetical protein
MATSRPGSQGSVTRARLASVTQSDAALTSRPGAGARSSETLGARAEPSAEKGRRPFYRSRVVVGSGLACVILLVVVVAVMVLNATTLPDRSSPQATVTGYFAALSAQDYARAWQYNAASRTNVSGESSFVNGLKSDDGRFGRVLSAKMSGMDSSGGQAIVQVDVTRAKAPDTVMSYSLDITQFDNDTWLISSITSTS